MILRQLLLSFSILFSVALQASHATTTTSTKASKNNKGMVMTVYNVGQGNGIVINVPGEPTFVCDAGSSATPTDFQTKYKKSKAEIAEEMQEGIAGNGDQVSCVISHPDKDHGNLIEDALVNSAKVKSLLGGSKKEYSGNKDLKSALKALEAKGSCKDAASCKTAKSLKDQLPSFVTVLAGNAKSADKNDQSLVLRAEYKDFSIILPGDATGAVVDEIDKKKLDASILVASHHGAQLHGTNSKKFIEKVDPIAIIISGNTMGGYLHPHREAVYRFVKHLIKKSDPNKRFHDVSYGALPGEKINRSKNNVDFITYVKLNKSIKNRSAYVAATNAAIYNTTNSGDITIEQKFDENDCTVFDISQQYDNQPSLRKCILNGINNYMPWIKEIYLVGLDFNDKKIKKIEALPTTLIALDVSNNKLTSQGVEHLLKIIKSSQCACKPELNCNVEGQQVPILPDQITVKTSPSYKELRQEFSIEKHHKGIAGELTHIVVMPKLD